MSPQLAVPLGYGAYLFQLYGVRVEQSIYIPRRLEQVKLVRSNTAHLGKACLFSGSGQLPVNFRIIMPLAVIPRIRQSPSPRCFAQAGNTFIMEDFVVVTPTK